MAKKIEIEITGDTKSLERALSKAQKSGSSFEDGMKKASKGALIALGAIGVGVAASVKAASDLSEQVNKTRVVFRGSEKQILSWSESTAESFGISQRAALEAAGTFGNMLVPMGIARDRAGEMSTNFVELAADMASFNNASPEETLQALRSGLAGETEPLRKFGVFLNQARIKQEALRLGLVKGKEELTASAKAQATYSIILQDTGDAQGDFARTSDSLANQQRILKAEFEDTAAALGTALLPIATDAAGVLLDLVNVAKDNRTEFQLLVGAAAATAAGIVLLNSSVKVYNSTALTALGTTKALRGALATIPWVAAGIAVLAFVDYIRSQGDESEDATDAQRRLTDAVNDYHRALKDGKNAREDYGNASRRVESAEIAVQRAIEARKAVMKDDNATLLDRREANLRVADAMQTLRDAEREAEKSGTRLRNNQLRQIDAQGRQRASIEDLAKEYRDWSKGIGKGSRIDTALERLQAGIDENTFAMHTGRANVERYADAVRRGAAQIAKSNPKLAETARVAARLSEAWGRVVSLPAAREFVARFRVITTVETNREIPRAAGGPVSASRSYIVGERGPEIFVPSESGRIVPNHIATAGNGGGTSGSGGPGQYALIYAGPDFIRWLQQENTRHARGNGGRSIF